MLSDGTASRFEFAPALVRGVERSPDLGESCQHTRLLAGVTAIEAGLADSFSELRLLGLEGFDQRRQTFEFS